MTNQDAPDRIWIEEDDGCPYFYDASELAEAGGPLIEYIRADLATPAPVVPAEGLERAREDEAKAGWALDMELLKELRSAAGDWGYSLDLEAVEAIALEVDKRLRAQQPAAPVSTDAAYQYALNLANSLRERLFPDNTNWRPLGDLLGLLTQIDNMTTAIAPPVGARVTDWQPIETAPYGVPVRVKLERGTTIVAVLRNNAATTEDGDDCDQWQAHFEGEHPECWTDGACWQSNADNVMSLQPRAWTALLPAGEGE